MISFAPFFYSEYSQAKAMIALKERVHGALERLKKKKRAWAVVLPRS
jgi:hypothetical protein